jgi:hypothetical protein
VQSMPLSWKASKFWGTAVAIAAAPPQADMTSASVTSFSIVNPDTSLPDAPSRAVIVIGDGPS